MVKWIYCISIFLLISTISILAQTPYVILISLDGFRWDYPDRGYSPTLDSIRSNGVSAISLQSSFPSKTFPNHLTIVTGMYPENHGLFSNNVRDPFRNVRFRLGDSTAVRDSRWYQGEMIWETAQRQGLKTASYFWPGSELPETIRRPTYRHLYDHGRPNELRVKGIIDWLSLPEEERPHFLTMYMSDIDDLGHRFGPESAEVNEGIRLVDGFLSDLFKGLKQIGMADQTNVVIVSDHGMTTVDTVRVINVEQDYLKDIECYTQDVGPFMFLTPKDAGQSKQLMQRFASHSPHFDAYFREDVPAWFHLSDHPFLPPIILIADMGWSLHTDFSLKRLKARPGAGNHGYDNYHMDMHGVFYAIGPNFKKGYRSGTLQNIDIYPLLCKVLGIMPRNNIDGDISRSGFLLRSP